jgi:hypothetical protein
VVVVRHAPPLHCAGVHSSGCEHWALLVHSTQLEAPQYGAPPLHAGPPLQLHAPAAHSFVLPAHCELPVQLEQPLARHTCPAVHAGLALQVQAPDVQMLELPLQSALPQHSEAGTHTLLHSFWPPGQPQPVAVHVSPTRHAAAPLHVQTPLEHLLLSPVHSESDEHVVQPDAAHTLPPPHAASPLHVQLPAWQVLVSPVQSALVQHVVAEMHALSQSF